MSGRRRLSLRWRVALTFGLASVLLSAVVGVITFRLAADYMLDQRKQSAGLQASINVRVVGDAIRDGSEGLDDLLSGIAADPGSSAIVLGPGGRRLGGRTVPTSAIPADLIRQAEAGAAASRAVTVAGLPVLLVAEPTAVPGTVFVEAFPLVELQRVYRFLVLVIVLGVLASGVLGVVLGRWLASRALRPLTEFTDSAGRMAAGDLTARLPERQDPDLAPLATTFNATAAALERRVTADARFAADVSHELRSPLTTMANAAEILRRRREELPASSRQAADLLAEEVDRFQHLVVDLLEISRTDEAEPAQAFEAVDVGVLVAALAATHPYAPRPEIAGRDLVIAGDRRRLARAVANLIDNAEQYGGGVVRLAVDRVGDAVRIEVDDTGPGVPVELREQIFERFARGLHAGQREDGAGSGLGLALTARHVRLHGGRYWVTDRPGGGARFVIELPAAEPHAG